jgi:Fe-Mn family superoxide dismutase
MPVQLPDLPYALDAFEPLISSATLRLHHDKHHRAYVEKTNKLIADTEYQSLPLDEIVRRSAARRSSKTQATLFNNAAQVWNHNFYWQSMRVGGGGIPSGPLAAQIDRDFRGIDRFLKLFEATASQHFGSGWAWLVLDRGKLRVVSTVNADTPMLRGQVPLLTCDVWEHAYYVDYQNRRSEYVAMFLKAIANWDFAAANLERGEIKLAAE